ncbi:tumor necrosis factor receptor superfamily member 6 isoform X2 [Xiphias gladius]|uniref:tumor necrosis factor receptor superfamily member 6 isoform X2 n=1 Tax=Xiphias gladius TaxID=8245 RepID=UPI001A99E7AA|nr:tumor necrosis factor receptor superfamily member 6 isoform X2 [Xiphias gladius]
MMASPSRGFPVCFTTFVLLLSHVSPAYSSASLLTEAKVPRPVKGLFRNRRQLCDYGDYKYEGRTCCLCGPGQKLESHCNTRPNDQQCKQCDSGTYSSHPNSQPSCEPCKSCDHPFANLEEAEPCTPAANTKCRCKKDHYCGSGTEICSLCHHCKECGAEGIKVACTSTNNTVCNDKTQGGNSWTIIGITVPIVIFAAVMVAVFLWRRRKLRNRRQIMAPTTEDPDDVEWQYLNGLDLQPHLPDIAAELGWKDMHDVAVRSGIPKATIESCQLDHHRDSEQQTLQLLGRWVEKEGRDAPKKLIQILEKSGKRYKAMRVKNILGIGSAAR